MIGDCFGLVMPEAIFMHFYEFHYIN